MDAREQLLLSEGVCRQLGLVMYHLDVQVWCGSKNKELTDIAIVPLVGAKLINSIRILRTSAVSLGFSETRREL